MRLIWRHLVEDAHSWRCGLESVLQTIGVRFLRDATLFTLFVVAPVVVVYSSRGLPTVLVVVLLFAVLHRLATGTPGRTRPAGTARTFDPRALPYWAIAVFVLTVYSGLSSLWAIDPPMAEEQATKMLLSFLMIVAIHRLLPPFQREAHRTGAALGVGLAAAVLIVELVTPGIIRPYIYGPNPAYLNRSVVTMSLLMWPALALTSGPHRTPVRIALVALVTIAVLVSSSRSSILAMGAGMLVMGMAYISGRLAAFGIVVVTAAAFIAMPMAAKLVSDLAVETGVDTMVDLSTGRRLEIWEAFSRAALERPLLGWGLESTRYFGLRDIPGVEWLIGPVHHPHNPILQIWVELGAIGVALAAIVMIGIILSIGRMTQDRRPFAYGAVTATLAVSTVSHGAWQSWWLCLLMLLVVEFGVRQDYPLSSRPLR